MTNEKIGDIYAKPQKNYISFNEALNLARQDEREKMQTEIGHLEYKIEGLQQALSRNKDDREKMQGVELTFDEIEMIKNCLPYGVTNLKYCIKSNLDLYNKYLAWERILPNLLSKLTTEAT